MWNWISKLEELQKKGAPFAIVTVTQIVGSTPRNTGAKMIVLAHGQFHGTIGGGNLEKQVIEDCLKYIETCPFGVSKIIRYPLGAKTGQCCGGIMEVLIEPIHCGPSLYVFGAGHVGQAVCKTLVGTPFTVHAIDERPEWINSSDLPAEVIRHSCEWSEILDQIPWNDQKTFVVVMTHRHDVDQEIIQNIIQRPARYIGLIGSHSKWQRFQQRLSARGTSSEALARVKSPIGLQIGGKAPQEIAISLAAELLQIYYQSNQHSIRS